MAHPTQMQALADLQDAHITTQHLLRETLERLELAMRPADLRTITLTAARPLQRDDFGHGNTSASIGMLNPTAINILMGIGGASATLGGRAVPVPAGGMLILPVAAQDIEIAPANPADLAAGDATVFVLRFEAVQAPYLWSAR